MTAAARGWGTGWPDCQRDQCVWITAGGIRLLVRAEVAPIFKGFCDELVQRGYPLGDVADDWGFACRPIRGSDDEPSNHSWGLAVDLNSTANPMGSTRTDFPAWAVELGETKYGLRWGGRYRSRPDPMHWEWMGTPDDAAWLVAALAALPADQQPPEPEENDMKHYKPEAGHPDNLGGGTTWVVIGNVRWMVPTTGYAEALQRAGFPPVDAEWAFWDVIRATTLLGVDQLVDSDGGVSGLTRLSDDDVARVAAAAADEEDRRARERLAS